MLNDLLVDPLRNAGPNIHVTRPPECDQTTFFKLAKISGFSQLHNPLDRFEVIRHLGQTFTTFILDSEKEARTKKV